MVGNENLDQTQKNPWDVLSLYQFQNFCCPSCVFKVPEKQDFIEHAYKNHPACVDFLSNIEDDSLSDIVCPWNIDIKIEENNIYEGNYICDDTGKSLSEALLFAEHGENMLCTKVVLNVRNNLCTHHVLPRFELGIFMY